MIEEGMYVEFIDYDEKGDKIRKIGQWMEEINGISTVYFYKWAGKNKMLACPAEVDTRLIKHAELREGAQGMAKNVKITIVRKLKMADRRGFYLYYCAAENHKGSLVISERDIKVQHNEINVCPSELFEMGEFCDPIDFLNRYNLKRYVSNAKIVSGEYESVIGKRIELLEHQMETVKTVIKNTPIRAILSDEVGLGKTIEALVILDYAFRVGLCKKALIIVPEQLCFQWYYEAKSKFRFDAHVFSYRDFYNQGNQHKICIISEFDFKRYYQDFNWKIWDIVICDEVHKIIRNDAVYSRLLNLSKTAENLLLLSATPLLEKGREMYRLLRLYNPEYYTALGLEGFLKVIKARKNVLDRMEKVSFGFKMNSDIAHARNCLLVFEDIATVYHDADLKQLIADLEAGEEEGLIEGVKLIFSYMERKYELKPKYIRHRRADILDSTSKRELYEELKFYFDSYDINGESLLYQTMQEEIDQCIKDKSISVENVMSLGSAFFSSAAAMNRILVDRNLYKVLPKTYHLNRMRQVEEAKTLSNSRIETLIHYLKGNDILGTKKTVIFTDYSKSAEILLNRLVAEFGKNRVAMFTTNNGNKEMHIANNSFKNLKECNFLVCDKSGAEGKNFQFADYIIHYDTPWIPTDLEQRIGRLDRIGRGKNRPVYNIVLYSADSIEEDLIAMCKNDLNIYDESLSGIEIVFDQITKLIKDSIIEKSLLGFDFVGDEIKNLKEKCEEAVQQELFDQMCLQVETGYLNKTQEMIEKLTGETYDQFVESVCSGHERTGKKIVVRGNEVYIEGLKEEGINSASGTFSIKEALREDGLEFLSLSHPLIKAISMKAINNDKFKTTAVRVQGAGFEWSGFVSLWELQLFLREYYREKWEDYLEKIPNTYIDESMLLLAKTYKGDDISASELMDALAKAIKEQRCKVMSLREIEADMDYSDVKFELQKSMNELYQNYQELMSYKFNISLLERDLEIAKRDLSVNKILQSRIKNSREMVEVLSATRSALKKTAGRLDSIIYVRFER